MREFESFRTHAHLQDLFLEVRTRGKMNEFSLTTSQRRIAKNKGRRKEGSRQTERQRHTRRRRALVPSEVQRSSGNSPCRRVTTRKTDRTRLRQRTINPKSPPSRWTSSSLLLSMHRTRCPKPLPNPSQGHPGHRVWQSFSRNPCKTGASVMTCFTRQMYPKRSTDYW